MTYSAHLNCTHETYQQKFYMVPFFTNGYSYNYPVVYTLYIIKHTHTHTHTHTHGEGKIWQCILATEWMSHLQPSFRLRRNVIPFMALVHTRPFLFVYVILVFPCPSLLQCMQSGQVQQHVGVLPWLWVKMRVHSHAMGHWQVLTSQWEDLCEYTTTCVSAPQQAHILACYSCGRFFED